MPTDIKLDQNTHDIDLTSGSLALIETNPSAVAQRVKVAILTKKGEWFIDVNAGLPYYQEFFKNKNNKALIDRTLISYISKVEGVVNLAEYSSVITNDRKLNVNITVETDRGVIVPIEIGDLNA